MLRKETFLAEEDPSLHGFGREQQWHRGPCGRCRLLPPSMPSCQQSPCPLYLRCLAYGSESQHWWAWGAIKTCRHHLCLGYLPGSSTLPLALREVFRCCSLTGRSRGRICSADDLWHRDHRACTDSSELYAYVYAGSVYVYSVCTHLLGLHLHPPTGWTWGRAAAAASPLWADGSPVMYFPLTITKPEK